MSEFNGKSFHYLEVTLRTKECVVCKKTFKPTSGINKFCTSACKGRWKYMTEQVTTDTQYTKISGNWSRYLARLLYCGGRKRGGLTRDVLLELLEAQDYKCALSGIQLTCQLSRGVVYPYNVSIDRIEAGGPYTKENIQLVCRSVNSFRNNTSVEDFISICTKVAQHNNGGIL